MTTLHGMEAGCRDGRAGAPCSNRDPSCWLTATPLVAGTGVDPATSRLSVGLRRTTGHRAAPLRIERCLAEGRPARSSCTTSHSRARGIDAGCATTTAPCSPFTVAPPAYGRGMTLHRATTGFDWTDAPRGIGSPRVALLEDRERLPRSPLHVVDVAVGATEGESLCGVPNLDVVDEHWERGLGGCPACRAEARRRASEAS